MCTNHFQRYTHVQHKLRKRGPQKYATNAKPCTVWNITRCMWTFADIHRHLRNTLNPKSTAHSLLLLGLYILYEDDPVFQLLGLREKSKPWSHVSFYCTVMAFTRNFAYDTLFKCPAYFWKMLGFLQADFKEKKGHVFRSLYCMFVLYVLYNSEYIYSDIQWHQI